MPPKNATSKKTEQKAKAKVIEDKTFGLKNKKGAKNQKYVAMVEKQGKQGGNPDFRKQEEENRKKKEQKEAEKKREMEMQSLFKSVPTQRVESGVDPKTVFCAFFKQNLCKKGDKCKFSHDPACERKAAKRNIYEEENKDDMDEWDDDKLAEVVKKKHGAEAFYVLKLLQTQEPPMRDWLAFVARLCVGDSVRKYAAHCLKPSARRWHNDGLFFVARRMAAHSRTLGSGTERLISRRRSAHFTLVAARWL